MLYQVVKRIEEIAKAQPNVGFTSEGDVYVLNALQNIEYAAVIVTQNTHTEDEAFRTYNLYVFYVDRLLDDKSNRLEIQSAGLECLSNIAATLRNEYEVGEIRYTPFNERFDSECAGVYMEISISVPLEACADEF